jgi:hypothetical protein
VSTTPAVYPAHGSLLSFNADGSFLYTPDPNFNGMDSFQYQGLDADGVASSPGTVYITVGAFGFWF